MSFARYSELFNLVQLQNREIFIHQPTHRRNFVKMVNADKTRIIGLPYREKTMAIR